MVVKTAQIFSLQVKVNLKKKKQKQKDKTSNNRPSQALFLEVMWSFLLVCFLNR